MQGPEEMEVFKTRGQRPPGPLGLHPVIALGKFDAEAETVLSWVRSGQ